jgi:hypothetical protein
MSAGVGSSQWARLAAALAERATTGRTYCAIVADLLAVPSVGVNLIASADRPRLCATDAVTALLEDTQFTAGEGPSVDASEMGRPVLAADLAGGDAARWPAFARAATEAGIHGAVAVPLRVGAARLGVLTAYAVLPGPPAPATYADAIVLGALLTREIVTEQAAAPLGALAAALADAGAHRAQVHQASGMIAVQLGIGIIEALVRLRTHAYVLGRPVGEVAAEVVARTMRFDR